MKKKNGIYNQKIKIFLLVLVLLLNVCLVFTGCSVIGANWTDNTGGGSDDIEGSGGGSSGLQVQIVPNKFKLGYRGTENDEVAEENIKNLASALVGDFASTYGAGKGHGDNQNVNYYDSIRYQAYEEYQSSKNRWIVDYDESNRWAWSFKNDENPLGWGAVDGGRKDIYETNVETHGLYTSGEYQNFYSKLYSQSMEVVLYEILLGRTDYQNMIVVAGEFDSNGYPVVTYRGESIDVVDGKLDFSGILTNLKQTYFDKATYFGFSLDDGAKIKNYIINYVIGTQAHTDKDGNDQLNANRNYNAYVDQLVDGKINSESEYFWYSRTVFKDGSLAISSTEDYFGLIPKAEYQSLVLMAEKEDAFSSCWIAFQSDRDLKISMYYRYYDGRTVRTTSPITIKVSGGKYDIIAHDMSYTDYGADVNNCFEIECFDNNDQVAAPTERSNSPLNEIYKPIASKNGYGCVSVFNEEMVETSFFEIVLDVEKNPNDPLGTDYSFQVALFGLIFKSDLDASEQSV
ncbi:MAG: hypothetical protein MSA47_02460 [Christensenellaceae bacterium]|nr:hypothetical protein [Christensenellaceae bacterium]